MTKDRELTELPSGLRRRMLPTAKLAARAGWRHMLRVAGRKSAPPDPVVALLSATDLVEDLGSFKGFFMKVGQLASFLPAREPDAAAELLARLQDKSASFAYPEIAKVVKAALGAAPEELFETFERRPIAVASPGPPRAARRTRAGREGPVPGYRARDPRGPRSPRAAGPAGELRERDREQGTPRSAAGADRGGTGQGRRSSALGSSRPSSAASATAIRSLATTSSARTARSTSSTSAVSGGTTRRGSGGGAGWRRPS